MLFTGDAWEGRPHCSKYLFQGPENLSVETPFLGLEAFLVFGALLWKANMPPEPRSPLNKGQWTCTKLSWPFTALPTYSSPAPPSPPDPHPCSQAPGHSAALWGPQLFPACWAFAHLRDIIFAVACVWCSLPHLCLAEFYLNITYAVFLPKMFNLDPIMRK